MDYEYFDKVISKLLNLEKEGIITIINNNNIEFDKLKLFNSFPDDFKYFLKYFGFALIKMSDSYWFETMIEELDSDDFDFLDFWSENLLLRQDSNKLFILKNDNSTFYAYHLDENPIKIHEYCFSKRTYDNIFELLDEQVVKVCEDSKIIIK